MSKWLTQEWLDETKKMAEGQPERPGASARMQYIVTGGPDGDVHYYWVLENGQIKESTLGDLPDAEVTMTQTYEDAMKIQKGELDAGAGFALARRVVGDQAVAEEVAQEVFLRLWNAPEKFDPARGSLRSYLLAQTHGRAVDLLRSDTSRRRREERDVRQTAEAGYDLEHQVWDLAVAGSVKEAMGRLPVDERRAIELAYFGGHTYREVAILLSTPEGTVKSRIRSGLRRMRDSLTEAGIGVGGMES